MKKYICLTLLIAVVLTLLGCSSEEKNDATSSPEGTASQAVAPSGEKIDPNAPKPNTGEPNAPLTDGAAPLK
jgi:uncharacterized lipoprotein NlpE involved in copper resistance